MVLGGDRFGVPLGVGCDVLQLFESCASALLDVFWWDFLLALFIQLFVILQWCQALATANEATAADALPLTQSRAPSWAAGWLLTLPWHAVAAGAAGCYWSRDCVCPCAFCRGVT